MPCCCMPDRGKAWTSGRTFRRAGSDQEETLDLFAGLFQLVGRFEGDPGAEGISPEHVGPHRLNAPDQLDVLGGHLRQGPIWVLAPIDPVRLDPENGWSAPSLPASSFKFMG